MKLTNKEDLIKRNLAIAYATSGLVRRIDGEEWIRTSDVKQSLNDVPTVEPKVKKVPIAQVTFDAEKLKEFTNDIVKRIENGEIVLQSAWIPIKTRPLTDEERKSLSQYYGSNYEDTADEWAFDCPMPEEGQEILISTSWGVSKDICEYDCTDDGMGLFSLEENCDWDGVTAWMPLPEPYKKPEQLGGEP